MDIRHKSFISPKDRTNLKKMSQDKIFHSTLSSSSQSSPNFNNRYQERPLEQNSHELSFEGLSSFSRKEIETAFESKIGKTAKEKLSSAIDKLASYKNNWIEIKGDTLLFKEEKTAQTLYQSVIDPVINFPVDAANSSLKMLHKIPFLKDSKLINSLLEKNLLKNRRTHLESYSNAMAIQNYAELMNTVKQSDEEISKLEKELKGKLSEKDKQDKEKNLAKFKNAKKEAQQKLADGPQRRFDPNISNYTTKAERSFTRLFSGLVPAFFLANDAYNLSMYMNNNKEIAKKEKQRRFNQEIARVVLTAGATFAALGIFAKHSNKHKDAATFIIAGATLISEVLGRVFTGVPFYPIGTKHAEQIAKQQNRNNHKDEKAQELAKDAKSKDTERSNTALKMLVGAIVFGLTVEKLQAHVKTIRSLLSEIKTKYQGLLGKDFTIKKDDYKKIIDNLKENGFESLSQEHEEKLDSIIRNGNLTLQEKAMFDIEVEKLAETEMQHQGLFIKDPDSYKKALDDKKAEIKKQKSKEIREKLNIAGKNDEIIYIGKTAQSAKSIIIDQILLFPIKIIWETINMPYRYLVKPLIELPTQIKKGKFEGKEKGPSKDDMTRNSIQFLEKISKDKDMNAYKDRLGTGVLDSFDNISKSNFSSAELGGAAKTAVSTVTSAFLVFDNYNRVMIDSEGKDKELAGQKAQERTIQRIVRIAYGAGLIKLFNGLFSKQYNASLVGAQTVNVGQSVVTEYLERASVGLPIGEATREEILENDKKNVEATGIKGAYFKIIAALTGKKPLSEVGIEI